MKREQIEKLLTEATPGKWRGISLLGIHWREDDQQEGDIEARGDGFGVPIRVCKAVRAADKRLIAAAPELARHYLRLLKGYQSARRREQRQREEALKWRREAQRLNAENQALRALFAGNLGSRLFDLLATPRDQVDLKALRAMYLRDLHAFRAHYPEDEAAARAPPPARKSDP